MLNVSRTKFTLKTFEETQPPFYQGLEFGNGNVFAHGMKAISQTVLDVFSGILHQALIAGQPEEAKG